MFNHVFLHLYSIPLRELLRDVLYLVPLPKANSLGVSISEGLN